MAKESTQDIHAKRKEIVAMLAKDTGVQPGDVEKVLGRLGIDTALSHQVKKVDTKNVRLAVSDLSL